MFHHKYNTDDVIIRAHIVGLVNELNNRISFYNVYSDENKKLVRVPFFYAMSGDEKFLQDYFSNWSDCAPDFIEGNTDPIPRGTIFLTGVSILGTNLTSRYVRGYYTKEIDGQLRRFNSYINSIPLQMNFSAEILADTSIDSFKIVQSAIATLYKTLVYSVNFEGFRVPVQVGFPEGYTINKQFEFTYGNNERIKVTFDIEVQGYLPIPDEKSSMFAGTNIQGTTINTSITPSTTTVPPGNPGGPPSSSNPPGTLPGTPPFTTGPTGPPPGYFVPPSDSGSGDPSAPRGIDGNSDGRGTNGGNNQEGTSEFDPGYWR